MLLETISSRKTGFILTQISYWQNNSVFWFFLAKTEVRQLKAKWQHTTNKLFRYCFSEYEFSPYAMKRLNTKNVRNLLWSEQIFFKDQNSKIQLTAQLTPWKSQHSVLHNVKKSNWRKGVNKEQMNLQLYQRKVMLCKIVYHRHV